MDADFFGAQLKRAVWLDRQWRWLWAVTIAGVMLCAAVLGAAEGVANEGPYFQVSGAEKGLDALPLKATEVKTVIAGPIADVSVTQTYRNEGTRPLEARYIFPGSTRAAVHGLTMTVGTRRIEAQIREKSDARRTYEKARSEGRVATLLEAHRSNLFEMNVANILPGETIAVELRYTEMLTPVDARYEWVFPTTAGARYEGGPTTSVPTPPAAEETATGESAGRVSGNVVATGAAEEAPEFSLSVEIVGGAPVSGVECASHRVENEHDARGTRVRLVSGDGSEMNRDFILGYRLSGDALQTGLLLDEWRGEKFFLLTVQPPVRIAPAAVPPRDYVFVVDVSGSMRGFPLDTAKKLLTELLVTLRAEDSFNVLLFSGGSQALAPGPVMATPENVARAVALIEGRPGGGGTELLPALEHALGLPRRVGTSRSVVVVTDGYVQVEAEAYALVRTRLGEANLFAFGIGPAVNRDLIERLARAGRAEAAVIVGPGKAEETAAKFRAMIEAPVLTQVRTEFPGFAVSEVQPAVQLDVLAQRPLTIVGKWSGLPGGKVKLRGFDGAGPWEKEIDVSAGVSLGECGVLAQLWARERVTALDDLHALNVDAPRQKAELVQLGLRYNLLTRFTSFVAVDTTPRVVSPVDAAKVDQALLAPETMVDASGVPTTPEPETVSLIVVVVFVVAWGVWRKRGRAQMRLQGAKSG